MVDEQGLREIALFAGAGGGLLSGHLLGWRTICAVEKDQYAAHVLAARQNDGSLAPFPIWDDVRTFSGTPWRGRADVVSGGFPCQDISPAGKGLGIYGPRSCLWKEFRRIIGEVGPRYAFIENSSNLRKKGLEVVLRDLAEIGYDAEWTCLSASSCGAPHVRDRMWILARSRVLDTDADVQRCEEPRGAKPAEEEMRTVECLGEAAGKWRTNWWDAEPGVGRVADGVADRVDRLTAIGNGQVPVVAAMAFTLLRERLEGGGK